MQITIVDYGMGNLRSVAKTFAAAGASSKISQQKADVENAVALVLPGVGGFGDGMSNLKRLGLIPALRKRVIEDKVPFLGICLGMQLLADEGFEDGKYGGLGWVAGTVPRLEPSDKTLKIPHMGWNDVRVERPGGLFEGLATPCFYFLHSYHLVPADSTVITATCDYGGAFAVAIQQGNIFGTQFHPEKSQGHGLQILRNFLAQARCP